MRTHDTHEFWEEMWTTAGESATEPDDLLVAQTEALTPGRALETGCGAGANAVWLAEHGWCVTAVDFAEAAVERASRLAKERRVEVEFVVADAASYRPEGHYDLITSFYLQLLPEDRRRMLATAAGALAPGGTLLFVGHDRSDPPAEWTEEDNRTLTTPEEVASELGGLTIKQAFVLEHAGEIHVAPAHASGGAHDCHGHAAEDSHHSHASSSTVVRAVRPSQ